MNLIKINADNPNPKKIDIITDVLRNGGVIIYPTDTVYAIGCLINNSEGLKRIIQFKSNKKDELTLSFLFNNISSISDYVVNFDNRTYRLLNKYLPGPYAFILKPKIKFPKPFQRRKKLGVRICEHPVTKSILSNLNSTLVTSSLPDPDDLVKYTTDPNKIFNYWKNKVDLIVDSGISGNIPSTVVDLTQKNPIIMRIGKGEFR